jgi:HK97 family phage prohead protease
MADTLTTTTAAAAVGGPAQADERDSFRTAVLAVDETGSGRSLSGLVIPYAQFAEIHDHMGHYQEQIAPGAFAEALRTAKPKMFFEHGKDVRIGHTPIGSFEKVWEETDGVHVRSRLFQNQLVQPLIDAARSGDLSQWSVHYRTKKDGSDESWTRAKGWDIRTVNHVREVPEISLVNFGAYQTTVSVRSLDQLTGRSDAGSADGGEPENEAAGRLQAARIRDRVWRMRK